MMEEISFKLKSGNPVLVASAVEKLLAGVRAGGSGEDSEALRALRDACGSEELVVSLAACQGLLSLVENGVLSPAHTMSTMLAMLPSAETYTAIISTIGGLLTLELRSAPAEYECRLSLRSPRHPLVTVLERSPAAADDVIGQMEALCCHPHCTIADNSVELLRAVFLWLLCHPSEPHSLRWRLHCWRLLLSLRRRGQPGLVRECLLWQLTSNPKHLQAAFSVYSTLAETALHQQNIDDVVALVPALANMSNNFILQGLDPRPCYTCVERCVSSRAPSLQRVAGLTLALLADNARTSPALYLHALYALCHNLVTTYEFPSIALSILIANSLQWLHAPTRLTTEALKLLADLLEIHRSQKTFDNRLHMASLLENELFQELLHTDSRLFFVFEQLNTWERVRDDKDEILKWFDIIGGNIHSEVKKEFVSLFLGAILEKRLHADVILKALNIALDVIKTDNDLMVMTLPILVYKVANDCTPKVQLECLKAIPLMASFKANVPSVVTVLNRLKLSHGAPASLLLSLHVALVGAQSRCYPYLQGLLLDPAADPVGVKWESDVAKAAAVRDICETRAATYGAELVPVVSDLLNRCADAAGAVASALALDALRSLWRERTVSPPSTWYALAPRMTRDKRPAVHVALCKLLGEVPALRASTADYDKFVAHAARTLWGHAADSHEPAVVAAACGALAAYRLDDYALGDVPAVYRRRVTLPASYCKTPVDAARRPEDVLDYIPCEIWPEVFMNTNAAGVDGVVELVSAYMEREIRGYRSGVYQAEARGKTEPDNLHYLPPHSVVRGMMEFIRKQEDEILEIFEILSALCRTVPPAILRIILQKYLTYAYTKMLQTDCNAITEEAAESLLFVRQLRMIAECLLDEKIHEANRTLLSQLVENYWTLISDDSVAWPAYEAACCTLSGKYLERMTSPSSWWETTAEALRRAARVRSRLAGARDLTTPLVWLNEIIGAAVACPSEHMFVLRAMAAPLASAPPDADSRDWLLQLMARVQIAIADSPEDVAGLAFLCDAFALATVLLSGCACGAGGAGGGGAAAESRALRCRLLPTAAAALLAAPHWRENAPQMIEWLQHTRTLASVPAACRTSFYRALVACRHAPHFAHDATWTRVLGARPS